MSTTTTQTYSQIPTEVVRAANAVDFAYRRVGVRGGIPLVLANYFAANLDDWDPLIGDGLAADRDVITFNYRESEAQLAPLRRLSPTLPSIASRSCTPWT